MERKNKDRNPIFYKSSEEMDKPLSVLMNELRTEIANVRGKLHDIKFHYGWGDRIEDLEGGLTCMIVAMANIQEEWKEFEKCKEENSAHSYTEGADVPPSEHLSSKEEGDKKSSVGVVIEDLRDVLQKLQERIDNPNSTFYAASDLKECWNSISESINKLELIK